MSLYHGTVVYFNEPKGYGFIWCDELKRRVFFHVCHLAALVAQVKQQVRFEIAPGKPGYPDMGVRVVIVEPAGVTALAAKIVDVDGVDVIARTVETQ